MTGMQTTTGSEAKTETRAEAEAEAEAQSNSACKAGHHTPTTRAVLQATQAAWSSKTVRRAAPALSSVVQQRTLAPQVLRIQNAISKHDETQLLIHLHQASEFLLTFTETFAEVVPEGGFDTFCGLDEILTGLVSEQFSNPDVLVTAGQCIKTILQNSPSSAKRMIKQGLLSSLVAFLINIEFIDLAEVSLDCLAKTALLHPRRCIKADVARALLVHLDFFRRDYQLTSLRAVLCMCQATHDRDFEKLIFPILSPLQAIIVDSFSDPEVTLHAVQILIALADRLEAEAFRSVLVTPAIVAVLKNISQNPTHPGLCTCAFDLLARTATLAKTMFCIEQLVEIAAGRLKFLSKDSAKTTESSEKLIEDTLASTMAVFLPPEAIQNPIMQASRVLGFFSVHQTFSTSENWLSPENRLHLLTAVESIISGLACSSSMKATCIIALYFCLSQNPLEALPAPLLAHLAQDICEVMSGRNVSLSVLALLTLAKLIVEVPPIRLSSLQYLKSTPALDQVSLSNSSLPNKIKDFVCSVMTDFCPDSKIDDSLKVAELCCQLETSMRKMILDDDSGLQELVDPHEKLLASAQDLLSQAKADPTLIPALHDTIDEIQRLVNQRDHQFSILLMESGGSNNHPLEALAPVCKPVRVLIHAENVSLSPPGKYFCVDAFASPSEVLDMCLKGPDVPGDRAIDLSLDHHTPASRPCQKGHPEFCTVKIGQNTLCARSSASLISIALQVAKASSQFFPAIESFFDNVVEINISPNPKEPEIASIETLESPFLEGLQECLEVLEDYALCVSKVGETRKHLINPRLTGKLSRQLRQVLLVVTNFIPACWDWIIHRASYLFDFQTKIDYIVAKHFGVVRYLEVASRWHNSLYSVFRGSRANTKRIQANRLSASQG